MSLEVSICNFSKNVGAVGQSKVTVVKYTISDK